MTDRNCLSYWYPILKSSGVPTPKTEIIRVPEGNGLADILDGEKPNNFEVLVNKIHDAAMTLGGYPVFLRTGQTSNKHGWKDTCFLASKEAIGSHVCELVEFSHLCDMMGLPHDVFVVREFLDLETAFTAFRGGFPVNRERRYFVRGGEVACRHAYWPEFAVCDGKPTDQHWQGKLASLNMDTIEDETVLEEMAMRVASAFNDVEPGYWSVDFAKTSDGRWLCIDMAEGDKSFHWLECPNCPAWMREQYANTKATHSSK